MKLIQIVTTVGLSGLLAATMPTESVLAAGKPDARKIMDKVALTRKLDGSEAVVTMTLDNGKGQVRKRKLALATKLFDGGATEKRIYRFLEPADVKGSGVLTFDYETKDDDTWVYLPALRKTRRIVSSKKSKKFMGSEFSFADLNFPNLDDFTYQVTKSEKVGGADCWVIEMKPKSRKVAESEGYSRKTFWVGKKEYTVRKALYYDLDGKLLKELRSTEVKLLDKAKKRYRSLRMEMINKQNGRRSVFKSEKITFNPKAKNDLFTTRYLERP